MSYPRRRGIFSALRRDFLLLLGDEERGLAIITPELTRKLTEEVHKLTQGGGEK